MKVIVSWQARKDEFRYPVEPVPRTAVLVPWFEEKWFKEKWFDEHTGHMRVFRDGWCEEAAQFSPQAVAATWLQLRALATSAQSLVWGPSPTHALVVLHRENAAMLTPEQRDLLWRRFGVPIFEQMIGPRGRLLASECEAHDGMHVLVEGRGWAVPLDISPCACGKNSARLRRPLAQPSAEPVSLAESDTKELFEQKLRAAAAYAR